MHIFNSLPQSDLADNSFFKYTSMALAMFVGLGSCAAVSAQGDVADSDELEFEVAQIYFELNNTDGDLGIHASIDGEIWRKLEIFDTEELRMFMVTNQGRLREQGITEIFFESAEPTFDELDPVDFFARFPEGIYEIEGVTIDDQEVESEAMLSHVLPGPPSGITVSGVPAAQDCDAELPLVTTPVTIAWSPVTNSHPTLGKTGPVTVEHYQLVIEREEPSSLVLSIDLPPDVTQVEVPEAFIALGDEFKYEILVRESTGNQTATESCFTTVEDGDEPDGTYLVTTADRAAVGEYGWAIFADGTKQWVNGTCRTQLQAAGLELEIEPWTDISLFPDTSVNRTCEQIANDDGDSGDYTLVTTPDRNIAGDYGWILASSGKKQWIDGSCRAQLQAAGLDLSVQPWSEISVYTDTSDVKDCDALLDAIR